MTDNNQIDDIISDDSDDYLVGYILEDCKVYHRIDQKYYEETNNKDKLVDFFLNNSRFGRIVIHHFILYKDIDGMFLFYINKNSEYDTCYVKYDIYRVKYSNFEKQEIEYSTKNESPYDYSLILESMRECYLQIRMVDNNCLNIFEYNPKLKDMIGMEYLYKLTGIGHNTMCCNTCHVIAKEDKFTDHFVNTRYSGYECVNAEKYCLYKKYCKTKNNRYTIDEHQIECEKKEYNCIYEGCSYRNYGHKLFIHDRECKYKPLF